MKIPFDKLAKISANCSGHMPKMAEMPIYGNTPLKPSSLEPDRGCPYDLV